PARRSVTGVVPAVAPTRRACGRSPAVPSLGVVTAPLVIDPTGLRGYNTRSTFPVSQPQTTRTLRLDFNLGNRTTMHLRGLQSLQNSIGVGSGQTLNGTTWGQY